MDRLQARKQGQRETVPDLGVRRVIGRLVFPPQARVAINDGIHILVGVGPHGSGMHTAKETMSVQGYLDRVKLDVEIVRALLR